MTLDLAKLGCAFTFMKYFVSKVSLIYLPNTLIWNKIKFPAQNFLKLAELVVNERIKSISKKVANLFFVSNLLLLKVNISKLYN